MEILPPVSASPSAAIDAPLGLDELLELASDRLGEEITSRTVRLYATQGLIDRPGKEGRSAVYGQRHLLQLLLIRSLARRGLSLSAIAPHVASSDQELEQGLKALAAQGQRVNWHLAGDCISARTALEAVYEGHALARAL